MNIEQLPKIDLHCHLDGSLTKALIERRLGRTVSEDMLTVSEECRSLTEYLEKFDLPLKCLQDAEGLEEGAYTFVQEIAKENMKYIEVRFAPMLSVHKQLSCYEIIEAVRRGMERAKEDFKVRYGIIVCAMRNHTLEQNMEMLACARQYLGKGVCALDLAGDESAFPTKNFRKLFWEAKRIGMPFTIHSGETGNLYLGKGVCALDLAGDESAFPTKNFRKLFWEAKRIGMPFTIHSGETGNLENVREALELGARRIGHGIALKQDPKLMKAYADAGIGVEMCPTSNFQTPTSNFQTKAVRTWEEYPLRQFLDAGIKVSINTDNRTVSGTTMTKELMKIYEHYGRDEKLIHTLLCNAAETAFDPEIKDLFKKEKKEV